MHVFDSLYGLGCAASSSNRGIIVEDLIVFAPWTAQRAASVGTAMLSFLAAAMTCAGNCAWPARQCAIATANANNHIGIITKFIALRGSASSVKPEAATHAREAQGT